MLDDDRTENIPRNYSNALLAAIAVALVCALGGLIWSYTLSSRLSTQQSELADAKQHNLNLEAKLRENDARLKVATEELGNSLGLTQKQMESRAQDILAREQADATRLSNAQKKTAQQVNEVSGEVTSVQTDVGGIKTNVAKAQSDLADTVTQLMSMKGDLSQHSSLIARNHDELDILKHKGDRTYYEFTLTRGQSKPVGTVSLLLKSANPKKNNFNLEVTSRRQDCHEEQQGVG